MRKLFLLVLLTLLAAGSTPGQSAPPLKLYGFLEDVGRTADPLIAKQKMDEVVQAGASAINQTLLWGPSLIAPRQEERASLETSFSIAEAVGLKVFLTVIPDWNPKAKNLHMPLSPHDRQQFVTFLVTLVRMFPQVDYIIIGNEPNLRKTWRPQRTANKRFNAPAAYERVLAQAYTPLKLAAEAREKPIQVIGCSLSSHSAPGSYNPKDFLLEMGEEYRRSGRAKPIMDICAIHPYGLWNGEKPQKRHRSGNFGFADYDDFRAILRKAFGGTGQSPYLPICYCEYGVETSIPSSQAHLYRGKENMRGVSPEAQGRYYREGVRFAYCQAGVMAFFVFHTEDEPDRTGWQSGTSYAGGQTLKPSEPVVRQAFEDAQNGNLDCR